MNAVQFACDTSLLYVTKVNIEVRDLNGVRMKTAVREGTISNIYSSVQEVKIDLVESSTLVNQTTFSMGAIAPRHKCLSAR